MNRNFNRVVIAALFALLSLFGQGSRSYSGTWKSDTSGNGGKLMFTFAESSLTAASFTLQGQEVKTKPISYKSEGGTVDFVFEYDVDGNLLRSSMQGTFDGTSLKGKYRSSPADGGAAVDEGTWEVTAK